MSAYIKEVPPQTLPASDVTAVGRVDTKSRHQLIVTDRIEYAIDGRLSSLNVKPTSLKLDKHF